LYSIEIIIDVKPFFGGSGIFFEELLPGDKRVNRYYISIEIYLFTIQDSPKKFQTSCNFFGTVPRIVI